MSYIHILRSRNEPRPWWRTDERCGLDPDHIVIADCCLCKMSASETDIRLWIAEIPLCADCGDYGYNYPWGDRACFDLPYDEARWETKCAEGFGCTVKPRRRSSRHLREGWYEMC